ncbi:MAG: pentapeptide repeat-containing protein [Pirellulales bacterium]
MKFSLKSLTVVVLIVGLLCGWYAAYLRYNRLQQEYVRQWEENDRRLMYFREELSRARDEVQTLIQQKPQNQLRNFWDANLEGTILSGTTLANDSNSFQRACFRNCKMNDVNLQGGGAAFQLACFDNADLSNSKLSGGSSSFQSATFFAANLTSAELRGMGSSFQGASFENAILNNAKLNGDFGGCNLSGAKLLGTDLSAIESDNLKSCYFENPPTYDSKTVFPSGFNPAEQKWELVESARPNQE